LRRRFTNLEGFAELAPYVTADLREDLDGARVSNAPRAGVQATLPNNLVLITEIRPREQLRTRAGATLHGYCQGYVALTAYPGGRVPVLSLSAVFGDAVDFSTDRIGRGETWSASVQWRPMQRFEMQPSFDYTRVRTDASGIQPPRDARESVAQLLATLHLTVRDRFRLIAQRVNVQDDLTSDTLLTGSLLFTHERSLTRRIYAGVSWSGSPGDDRRETTEVFIKLQWGMSAARGIRW